MCIDLQVKSLLFCQILFKIFIFTTGFGKIKFYENPSNWRGVFHVDGWMDTRTDGHTGITKAIVAFRNFSNAPKNH